MSERLCVFCEHWEFSGGEQGYSEMTPGSDASMGCGKGHWDDKNKLGHRIGHRFRIYELNGEEDFRAKILTAENCKDYAPPAAGGGK